ncbi:MAG TPA: CopG family transcriptional regulator [Acidiferrobacteraceae bacterium]|nr:CopG family transcriptional regulator [Acidiferrobacteraceae bacterium]
MAENFSKGKRGSVVKADPSKVRITIRLDADIIEHFKKRVHHLGGGNYQTFMNDALREYIGAHDKELENALRKIIREELKRAVLRPIDTDTTDQRLI